MPGAFRVGSELEVTTRGRTYVGEVMAFDPDMGLLMMRRPVAGLQNRWDVTLVNMDYVEDVKVVRHNDPGLLAPLSRIDEKKNRDKLRRNLEEVQRKAAQIGVNVTSQAQRLFCRITRTIQNTRWEGQTIVALDEVWISPPYGVDDCRSNKPNSQALVHVKKIVQKFLSDTAAAVTSTTSACSLHGNPGTATSVSSASNTSLGSPAGSSSSSTDARSLGVPPMSSI